ncbi:MAG: condensation domain-containing protein, partial [Thermoanaerobaculia bacterium]
MTTVKLIAELRERQVELWLEGDRLRYRAPEGGLTPELRSRLQEHRERIVEFLQSAREAVRSERAGIPRAPEGDLPLSFGQSRLWFLQHLEPSNPSYNMPAVLRLEGELDLPVLEAALSLLVRRHEPLRTTFLLSGGRPVQVVGAPAPIPIPAVDLSALPPAAREDELRRRTAGEARRPFDLKRGPILRLALLRLGPAEHRLVVVTHHIAADGLSIRIFFEELAACYGALSRGEAPRLPDLPVRYADYAWWQQERFQGAALAREVELWREWLAGAPELTELPSDRPRPAALSWRGGLAAVPLPRGLADRLMALRRQAGVTSFMLFLAAWGTLLARSNGQSDLLVGSPVAGRLQEAVRDLIGFFVNTLVFRL